MGIRGRSLFTDKRSFANAIELTFNDGSKTDSIETHYPIGHQQQRKNAILFPCKKLKEKLQNSIEKTKQSKLIGELFDNPDQLAHMSVSNFLKLF